MQGGPDPASNGLKVGAEIQIHHGGRGGTRPNTMPGHSADSMPQTQAAQGTARLVLEHSEQESGSPRHAPPQAQF